MKMTPLSWLPRFLVSSEIAFSAGPLSGALTRNAAPDDLVTREGFAREARDHDARSGDLGDPRGRTRARRGTTLVASLGATLAGTMRACLR